MKKKNNEMVNNVFHTEHTYIILLPIYNEGNLLNDFLNILENKLTNINVFFKIVFVNDGSTDNSVQIINNHNFNSKNLTKEIIELNGNGGQQNAIRSGLNYVNNNYKNIYGVIVMDADGEDNPDALSELIEIKDYDVVFVTRGKREESYFFKISYIFYKLIFKIITGKQINFGNYSMISPKVLNNIAEKHYFHYSAFLSKQKFNIKKIQYNRNKRINGVSKMGFKNLFIHALKSFTEYSEELIFFQIKVFLTILLSFSGFSIYVFYSKFISKKALIGWSSNLMIGLINGLLIMFSSIIISTLLLIIKNSMDQKNIYLTKNNLPK